MAKVTKKRNMNASADVNNQSNRGYIVVAIGALACSMISVQPALAKSTKADTQILNDGDAPNSKNKSRSKRGKNIQLEYRLDGLEARLNAQAAQLDNQQRLIDQQTQIIAEQARGLQNQMLETNRLRVALAGQGKWDAIDRTLPQSGRFQTVQLSPQPQMQQEQTIQNAPV